MSRDSSGRRSLATEGRHAKDYDPLVTGRLLAEAVRVLRSFGFANAHAIILGGLVPSLLIPEPEAGIEPHVGTQDLDLCLTVALIEGDVADYERLEVRLREAGFEMARQGGQPVSWQWVGGVAMRIVIEFFCPAGPGRDPGKLHRPRGVVGGKLSAISLAAGRLVDLDHRSIEVEVELPDGGGRTKFPLRVAGPAAYLASKADALLRRSKNKDAYDIVWIVEAWPGGQVPLAAEISRSAIAADPDFHEAVRVLNDMFKDVSSAGAIAYARFMAGDGPTPDQLAQQAVGAIRELLDALDSG